MTLIVQISDPHFGTEIPAVQQALLTYLRTMSPEFVIVSGDITQRARSSQFATARKFFDDVGAPFHAIPGNHDLPLFNLAARLINPYGNYKKAFGTREFFHRIKDVAIVGLDASTKFRHTRGRLIFQRARKDLAHAREMIGETGILLVAVHQPILTAWGEDRPEELLNSDSIANLFSDMRVDAILSGHVHVPLICTTDKAYPKLDRPFVHSGAGTAVSHRTREGKPNSFNSLKISENQIEVTLHQFAAGGFAPVETHLFKRDANGWTQA